MLYNYIEEEYNVLKYNVMNENFIVNPDRENNIPLKIHLYVFLKYQINM